MRSDHKSPTKLTAFSLFVYSNSYRLASHLKTTTYVVIVTTAQTCAHSIPPNVVVVKYSTSCYAKAAIAIGNQRDSTKLSHVKWE